MDDIPRPEKIVPPVIMELFKLLPREGNAFREEQRKEFLLACEALFNVVYTKTNAPKF